jgi:ribosomal protein S16
LEILGSYNPHTKDLDVKADRINHWISMGAQPSATVNNLLIDKNIIKGDKMVASKPGEGLKKIEEAKKAEAAAKAAAKTEPKKEVAPEVKEDVKIA